MKKTLIIAFAFQYVYLCADTTVIALSNVHHFFGSGTNKRTIIDTIQLPSNNDDYQRILMHINLACPTDGCDPWDRKASISVKHLNEWYEIGRYVTPYGVGCGWTLDVTDYRSVLKGEISLSSFIDTWVQPAWLVTIQFEYISGIPDHPFTVVRNMWNDSYIIYGDSINPINIQPITEYIPDDMQSTYLRIIMTGHGQGNTDNAAEFSQKIHQIYLNNVFLYDHDYWRNDCQNNTCSPQYGTWQYNRAGFCPGDIVEPQDFDLSPFVVQGDTATLSYILEDYFNECSPNNPSCNNGVTCASCNYNYTGHTEPNYFIASHLIIHTANNHSNADAYVTISEDSLSGALEIAVENYVPVYGIQFDIDVNNWEGENLNGLQFQNGFSGRAEAVGWTVSMSESGRMVALSQNTGGPLPAGEGVFTYIPWNHDDLPGIQGSISITNIYVSGYFGSELSHEIGPKYNFGNILRLDKSGYPPNHHLLPAFPNPFNPTTTIPFHVSNDQVFDLDIYDINGKKIQSLLKNVELQMGEHQIRWNANKFGSGLYFVQLKNNKNILTQKIMLLK